MTRNALSAERVQPHVDRRQDVIALRSDIGRGTACRNSTHFSHIASCKGNRSSRAISIPYGIPHGSPFVRLIRAGVGASRRKLRCPRDRFVRGRTHSFSSLSLEKFLLLEFPFYLFLFLSSSSFKPRAQRHRVLSATQSLTQISFSLRITKLVIRNYKLRNKKSLVKLI